jgi:hypothetical protein
MPNDRPRANEFWERTCRTLTGLTGGHHAFERRMNSSANSTCHRNYRKDDHFYGGHQKSTEEFARPHALGFRVNGSFRGHSSAKETRVTGDVIFKLEADP